MLIEKKDYIKLVTIVWNRIVYPSQVSFRDPININQLVKRVVHEKNTISRQKVILLS